MNKILIIDGDPEVRSQASEILSPLGFTVYTAEDGYEGIRIFGETCPDLVICDHRAAEMCNYEIYLHVKKYRPLKDIPFIFLSGASDSYKAKSIGNGDCIVKPFSAKDLVDMVHSKRSGSKCPQQALREERMMFVKELEEIVYMLSHNVRSPLCSSLGLLQILDETAILSLTNDELRKTLLGIKVSHQQAVNCTRLLSDKISGILSKHKSA